jgi:hypothetical protein
MIVLPFIQKDIAHGDLEMIYNTLAGRRLGQQHRYPEFIQTHCGGKIPTLER